MSVVNTYKVHYHHEVGGKKSGPDYMNYVQAAAGDYTTIKNVLSSNSLVRGTSALTLVIDSVQEVGHGDEAKA